MVFPKHEYNLFLSETIGTALLLFFGLSAVIFNWGEGSWTARVIPSPLIRTVLTGFMFGSVGCLVALSPVGRISGAHINPAVSLAFWLRGKMKTTTMIGYIISQMTGAAIGCFLLLVWGHKYASTNYGATMPENSGLVRAFYGEMTTTACLITDLYIFIGIKKLRNYTPYTMPILYSILNLESPISGCSTNPARSFGPALVSGDFAFYWLYWLAPLTGVLIVTAIFRLPFINKAFHVVAPRISFFHQTE